MSGIIMHPPPGRRLFTAGGSERARPGGGHSILLLIHDLPISGPDKKKKPTLNQTLVTMAYPS